MYLCIAEAQDDDDSKAKGVDPAVICCSLLEQSVKVGSKDNHSAMLIVFKVSVRCVCVFVRACVRRCRCDGHGVCAFRRIGLSIHLSSEQTTSQSLQFYTCVSCSALAHRSTCVHGLKLVCEYTHCMCTWIYTYPCTFTLAYN